MNPLQHSEITAAELPVSQGHHRRHKWLSRGRDYIFLYLLLAPTLISMLVFGYYPKLDVIVKSVYRWNGSSIKEFIGSKNYLDAVADPLFWQSFRVVAIMLVANVVKMWPGIIVAIALHRLLSDRWRYLYQVCFVIPMVVPMMVWLLVWKGFFDPDFGIINKALNLTGGMSVLAWLDGTDANPGLMPQIAGLLQPIIDGVLRPVFGGVWAMMLLGGVIVTLAVGRRRTDTGRWMSYGSILLLAVVTPILGLWAMSGVSAAALALVTLVAVLFLLSRTVGEGWVLWPFLILYGVWACNGDYIWRLPALLAIAFLFGELIYITGQRLTSPEILRWTGTFLLLLGVLFVLFGKIWTEPTNQFVGGSPAWLGNQKLVLPSLIMWGFPWVGTVGVLIYLAGLQQISADVYEAAELDGVGPVGKLFRIELPLIMTQVRINLIMMTIGTLTGYEFYLILLGPNGGPGNIGMVPGLYMYKSAFIEQQFGYACALGMVLFVAILLLTIVYQKYVKVDK